MKLATALSDDAFGSLGIVAVWADNGGLSPNPAAEIIPLPSTVNTLDASPDFPAWKRGNFSRVYFFGGHTDNLVFTEHKWVLRVGINAPSAPWVTPGPAVENQVSYVAAAGGGLTGSCSFALRFLDSLHFRRSPLGASSPAIALSNQGATFGNVPLAPCPVDPCVDKVEIYVSVDGGLYRHWATRDIGTPAFTVNETTTGEAYTEELTQFPKLGFGDMANDRGFYAGDPRHPDRIYVSQVSNPEEYTGLFLTTRNGEPVIGLRNIGGSIIYVQCPNSCYYIQGFNAGDLTMRLLKSIGGFGQRSMALFDDFAMIPTPRGWFKTDGTSMIPVGSGMWDATWRKSVADIGNGNGMFAVVDTVTGVIKLYGDVVPAIIGFATPDPLDLPFNSIQWVIDYAGLGPELGGAGEAELSFDVGGGQDSPSCAAMMFNPGSQVGSLYTGTNSGNIMRENVRGAVDKNFDGSAGKKIYLAHTAHHSVGPAPDPSDAWKHTDVWIEFLCEDMESKLGLWAGNQFAWQASVANNDSFRFAPTEEFTIPAGRSFPADPAINNAYVPRDNYLQANLAKASGSALSIRLLVVQTQDNEGFDFETIEQRSEVIFYGWGFVSIPGTENQPLGPWLGGG